MTTSDKLIIPWWSPDQVGGDYHLIQLGVKMTKYFHISYSQCQTAGLLKLLHWSNKTATFDHFLPKSLIKGSVWSSLIWGVFSSMSNVEPEGERVMTLRCIINYVDQGLKVLNVSLKAKSWSLAYCFTIRSAHCQRLNLQIGIRQNKIRKSKIWGTFVFKDFLTWLWCGFSRLLANGRRRSH